MSNAVYRLSLSSLVFEFSGGGGGYPPPGRAKVAQKVVLRELKTRTLLMVFRIQCDGFRPPMDHFGRSKLKKEKLLFFFARSSFILWITYPLSSVTPPLAGPGGRCPPGM